MKMLPFVLETIIKRRFNRLQLNWRFIVISVSYFWLKFSNIHLLWDYIIYPWVLSVGLELIYVNIFEKQGMSSKFFYEIFWSLGKHVHGWFLIDLLFGSRLPLVLVNYQQTDKKTDKQIDDLVTPIPIIRTFPYFSNILTIRLNIIVYFPICRIRQVTSNYETILHLIVVAKSNKWQNVSCSTFQIISKGS